MKNISLLAAFAATFAGCVSDTTTVNKPTDFVRVSDAASFSAVAVDRRIEVPEEPEVWFRLNSSGTLDGELKRGTVKGMWVFENGYWCREFEAGGRESPYDCQLVELLGDQIRLTRNKGEGNAGTYLLK